MIVLLFLVSIAAFALVRLMPGDIAFAYLNSVNAPVTGMALAKVRVESGLGRPVISQYTAWLGRVVCLDLDVSFMTRKPVPEQLLISFRHTMILTVMSVVWIAVLSLPLGIMAGKRLGSAGDQLIRGIMLLGSSILFSWLGFLLVGLFALKLKLFPVQRAKTFSYLALPSAILACSYIAMYTKMIRDGIVGNMGRWYAVCGRARGPKKDTVLWRHVLPNALDPVFTTLGLSLGSMLSGAVIVENVFAWPGMGRLIVSAATGGGYPVIRGYIPVITVVYTLLNLDMNILCAAMDSRIRFEGEER